MRTKRRFTEAEALLRRFLLLAGGGDWNGSMKLDHLLEDAREHLEQTAALPGDFGEPQELPC